MDNFKVRLQKGLDGYIIAEAVELPGCISQGKTTDEALDNIKEAISGYLDSVKAHGGKLKHFDIREVHV